MSDYIAKMYQIRFWLGLLSRPQWGSLQRSPDSLAGGGGTLLPPRKKPLQASILHPLGYNDSPDLRVL